MPQYPAAATTEVLCHHCLAVESLLDVAEATDTRQEHVGDWADLRRKIRLYPLGLEDLDWLTKDDLHYFVPSSIRRVFFEVLKLWQRRDSLLVESIRAASADVDDVISHRRSWSSH